MPPPDKAPATRMVRFGETLHALSEFDADALARFPAGRALVVEIKQPRRSIKQNRLYWGVIREVKKHLDQDIPENALHEWFKLKLGVVVPILLKNGEVEWVTGSTAFDEMEPHEFNDYFRRMIDLVTEHLIPKINSEALKTRVEQMLVERRYEQR